jgi:hypothetical protein
LKGGEEGTEEIRDQGKEQIGEEFPVERKIKYIGKECWGKAGTR